MKINLKNWCCVIAAVILIAGFVAGFESQVNAQNAPRIIPVQAPAVGATYSEWSARWWQWSVTLLDPGCGGIAPDRKNVWFLTGFSGERTCNVPAGKFLFFPIVNTECSTIEPPPFFGESEEELRDCAMSFVPVKISAEIDGVEVTDLYQYFVISPMFDFTAIEGNWNGVPAGEGQSVSTGYWLMVAPLSPGKHKIIFKGSYESPPSPIAFSVDATYTLNIGR